MAAREEVACVYLLNNSLGTMNTEESKDSFLYVNIDFNKSIILDKNLIAIYCVF